MKLIRIKTSATVIYKEIYKVPDNANLDEIVDNGLPQEAILVDTIDEEFIGYNEILEAEEI